MDNIHEHMKKKVQIHSEVYSLETFMLYIFLMFLAVVTEGDVFTEGSARGSCCKQKPKQIDEKLEFNKHIKVIINRANRMLGMISSGFRPLANIDWLLVGR